jgi:hypothetical protein
VSTPSRIRTGDLLRESSETHEAAISSYAGLLDLSPRPLPLGRFAGLCGSFPGVLAATGGPRPNPRAWTRPFGDHSPGRPTRTRGDGGRDGFRRAPTLDASHVADNLERAHALTGHGAHGATVEWARVIGRPSEFTREWAYTSLSRARARVSVLADATGARRRSAKLDLRLISSTLASRADHRSPRR